MCSSASWPDQQLQSRCANIEISDTSPGTHRSITPSSLSTTLLSEETLPGDIASQPLNFYTSQCLQSIAAAEHYFCSQRKTMSSSSPLLPFLLRPFSWEGRHIVHNKCHVRGCKTQTWNYGNKMHVVFQDGSLGNWGVRIILVYSFSIQRRLEGYF